jgi:hypothetical protein
LLTLDDTKRKIDPGIKGASRLGELVEPEVLGCPRHDQKAPRRKIKRHFLLLEVLVLEVEAPGRS